MPNVSIITPIHNTAELLPLTIDSVIAQSYPDWELLLIDDKSTDSSPSIARSYAATDRRIRLIQLEENSGPAVARNHGIQTAEGRYIAFLDSDDLWLPEKLEIQTRFMEENGLALGYSWFERISFEGGRANRVVPIPTTLTYHELLKKNHIGCLTAIYDSELVGKRLMPEIPVHQDWALWLSILRDGFAAGGVPDVLALYRTGNMSSVSGNKLKTIRHKWHIYRQIEQIGPVKSAFYLSCFAWEGFKRARI